MNNYEKIINFISEKGNTIKIFDFKEAKISFYYINKLIEDNYVTRVGRGLYRKSNSFSDDYFIIQNRYKNAIFSFNTALFFLNKTEVTPSIIDVTIPNDYNVKSINTSQIRVHYTSRENINLGVIEIISPFGNKIKSYNLERTICDIVKNKNKCGLDIEQRNKIIRESFINGNINVTTTIQYAKKLKCEKKVRAIMEVIL